MWLPDNTPVRQGWNIWQNVQIWLKSVGYRVLLVSVGLGLWLYTGFSSTQVHGMPNFWPKMPNPYEAMLYVKSSSHSQLIEVLIQPAVETSTRSTAWTEQLRRDNNIVPMGMLLRFGG